MNLVLLPMRGRPNLAEEVEQPDHIKVSSYLIIIIFIWFISCYIFISKNGKKNPLGNGYGKTEVMLNELGRKHKFVLKSFLLEWNHSRHFLVFHTSTNIARTPESLYKIQYFARSFPVATVRVFIRALLSCSIPPLTGCRLLTTEIEFVKFADSEFPVP